MKNKRIYIAMLILSVSFLIGMYILKIFFPQEFVMAIQNERIIRIGDFIDNHKWLYYICCSITSFITYWLYLCAVTHKLYLNLFECLYVVIFIIVARVCNFFDTNLATHISISSFIILPAITKADMFSTSIVYFVHGLSQILSLSIRNLPIYLTNINYLTTLIMTCEMYLWLILFYIIYNFKGENKMGLAAPPYYGNSKFYAKKKARAEKKIAKLQEVIKVCDEKLSSENK